MNKKGLIALGLSVAVLAGAGSAVNAQTANTGSVAASTIIVDTATALYNLSNNDYKNIMSQLSEIDIKSDELNKQESELKNKYRSGQITREEYMAKIADIDAQKAALDKQEDELELKLDAVNKKSQSESTDTTDTPEPSNTDDNAAADGNKADLQKATSIDDALKKLADIDRQDYELDRQEDELEFSYRTGRITRESFLQQMSDVDRKQRELDIQEDALEAQIAGFRAPATSTNVPNTNGQYNGGMITPEDAYKKSVEIEVQENELDRQEDALELQYIRGEISSEEFFRKKAEIEAKENQLDFQEELYDWDD